MAFRYNTDIGQNFLRDRSIVDWMMACARLTSRDIVLEVGPGNGVLTRGILGTECSRLDAIELDTRLRGDMEAIADSDRRLALHWGDAVNFDYSRLTPPPTHVIANLPYHITTPLIWRLIEALSGSGLRYMLVMVQVEAASRLTAGAGNRDSNPLGITLSAMGEASVKRRVSRTAFYPTPRVDSAIVEVKFSGDNTSILGLPRDKIWRRLLSGSFASRRKTLVNNWWGSFGIPKDTSTDILASHSLGSLSRPEEISGASWTALYMDAALASAIDNKDTSSDANDSCQ
ncbi:MAG: 16S rRNA (adenine(1518)-N(6)/adenine(1519)-N(6))-dimethyltransferase RsmA [Synergistaceae bacterium]|jgi:16S rRNA (adenine1518-N6/adenine1519-N6)-dimethyltransferase|nr:16S rRNA (adenine(1518)-N(6)/adenine(1519)-N(6))-dimethyltransferase RsmA [Synergistaceae bacterium]